MLKDGGARSEEHEENEEETLKNVKSKLFFFKFYKKAFKKVFSKNSFLFNNREFLNQSYRRPASLNQMIT